MSQDAKTKTSHAGEGIMIMAVITIDYDYDLIQTPNYTSPVKNCLSTSFIFKTSIILKRSISSTFSQG